MSVAKSMSNPIEYRLGDSQHAQLRRNEDVSVYRAPKRRLDGLAPSSWWGRNFSTIQTM